MSWECLELPRIACGGVYILQEFGGGRRGGAGQGSGVSKGAEKGRGDFFQRPRGGERGVWGD